MATTKVTKLWTAFLVVIVKFLAALGFRTPAASSVAFAAIPAPAEGEASGTAAAPATGAREATAPPGSRTHAASRASESPHADRDFGCPGAAPLFPTPRMTYGRTLPPTMKQRIRAEAHGAAPSSRCVQSDAFDAPYAAPYPAPYSAPVGAPPARAAAVPSPRGAVPAARRPERVLCPA